MNVIPVGIPKELKPAERRVSLTPKGTEFLFQKGIPVYIEEGAGSLSGFSDQEYKTAGGILISEPQDLWAKARLIKKVKEPIEPEFQFFSSQHLIFTFLHLASPSAKPLILALEKAKTTAIAYETIEKDKELPLLKPMSEIAGVLAAYYGAILQKNIEDKNKIRAAMREATDQYPAVPVFQSRGKVLILGGGHVGEKAAITAARMGADVTVSEVSEARRIELRGAGPIHVIDPANLKTYYECLSSADVIIAAVHSAGKRAPLVIDQELLKKISVKRKIILDVAIDQGGNVFGSRPIDYEELLYLDEFQNLRFSVTNIPSFCGRGASIALETASLEYTAELAQGLDHALRVYPELKSGINVLNGKIHLDVVKL